MENPYLKAILYKYKHNKTLKNILIQAILVYHKIRPGASIESLSRSLKIIEREILPLLDKLNIYYVYKRSIYTKSYIEFAINLGVPKSYFNKPQYNLYISYKPIKKDFMKTDKMFGKFLGYKCASNNFSKSNVINGRIIYSIIETRFGIPILTEVCKGFQSNMYYKTLLEKTAKLLNSYKLILKLSVYNEKTGETMNL